MIRVAVTGINGFVGGLLFDCLSRRTDFAPVGLSTRPASPDRVRIADGIPQGLEGAVNCIVHCGGLVGNGFSKAEYQYANVECMENLVKWCEAAGVAHFIYCSSGAVYRASDDWLHESFPVEPATDYARSKLQGEDILARSAIPVKTVLRLFFPYGPLKFNHLVSRLARTIAKEGQVSLNDAAGKPWISPVYIGDVAAIVGQAVARKLAGIYNLSGPEKISIKEIAATIFAFYGLAPRYVLTNTEVPNYLGSPDKIIGALRFSRLVSPVAGLQKVLQAGKDLD